MATVLYCVEVPRYGGETLYASGKHAFKEFDETPKQHFSSLKVVYSFDHLYNKLNKAAGIRKTLTEKDRQRAPEVVRPLVRTHSVTDAKALWFTQAEMKCFEGLSQSESQMLGEEIVTLISKPEYVYAHKWEPGDLLVWDNRWMHHSTTSYTYPNERRLMHRVSGEGDEIPF